MAESWFDLIVADYHLPDGHATELFDEIRDTPFILLSGTLEEQLALRTLERGADDYLQKDPQGRHLEALPSAVEKTLHRKRIHDTERRLTQELRQSEERYRLLVEGVPEHAVVLIDMAGRILSWNAGAQRVFGWTKEDIAGQAFDVLFTPEDRAAGIPAKELTQAREFGRGGEDRWLLRKDGTRFYAAGSTAPIRDEKGVVRSYVKVASDATRQKLAERVLRESEQLVGSPGVPGERDGGPLGRAGLPAFSGRRSLVSRYGVAVAIAALALLVLAILSSLFSSTAPPLVLLTLAVAAAAWWGGLGPGLVCAAISIVATWWAFVPPRYSFAVDDPAEVVRMVFTAICSAAISVLAEAMHRAAGRQRLAIRRLAAEVQERRKMEATLREQAQLLDLSYDAVFAWPLDGPIRYWNLGAERLYGYTRAEAMGRVPHELLRTRIEGGPAAFIVPLKRDKHWSGELRHRGHDGREVVVESRMVLVPGQESDGGPVVIESNRDVSPRRQAEEARTRLAAIVESSDDAILSEDLDGIIQSWNAGAQQTFGYSAKEAIGRPISLLIPPDRMEEEAAVLQRLREGEHVEHLETLRVAKDGRRIDVSVTISPIKDHAGRIVGASKIARDITERKRAEEDLKAAKDSAERAKAVAEEANRAKDHFLAVLSHELRTPLAPVLMGVSMLQDRPDLNGGARETLEMVRRNVEMEARLIDDLLDMTRIARGKVELRRQRIDLHKVIGHAVDVCRPDIEARGLNFGVDIGTAGPYWVDADPGRLQQVFWNLLRNAIKFTPHEGCVGIRCRLDERGLVAVEVNDSGMGIEAEALPTLFNAFEQGERSITRQFGGLGLGLTISKALVEMHGGSVEVRSEGKDKGATFCVRLPLIAAPGPFDPAAPAAPRQSRRRPLRILLVEDHGVTAKMMRMVLTAGGHAVETAGDVATAVELAKQHPFDLLLSDLGLPDGSGHDLMRELRRRGHTFPGIALSGYGQEEDIRHSREAGFAAHLTKPASREAVVEAVASVTAGEPTAAGDDSTTISQSAAPVFDRQRKP